MRLGNREVDEFLMRKAVGGACSMSAARTTARAEKEKVNKKMKHLLLYLEGRKVRTAGAKRQQHWQAKRQYEQHTIPPLFNKILQLVASLLPHPSLLPPAVPSRLVPDFKA